MNDREQGPEIDVLIGRDFSLKFRSYFTTHCHSYTGKWFLLPGKGSRLDNILGGVPLVSIETSSSTCFFYADRLVLMLVDLLLEIFSKENRRVKACTSIIIELAMVEFSATEL